MTGQKNLTNLMKFSLNKMLISMHNISYYMVYASKESFKLES